MCKLVTETKQLIKVMHKADKIGNYHPCISIKSFLNDYKKSAKGESDKTELFNDTLEYRQQYLTN